MALTHLFNKFSILPRIFQPTTDALFSTLPFTHRWRLLLLQPINILCLLLTAPTFLFKTSYTVSYIPTRSGPKRCLVFQPPRASNDTTLRPLHVDFHGGGFIGGFPEQGVRWCTLLAERTGAVVVSGSYRLAPRHIYPAAQEDVDDIVSYLLAHAEELGADKDLLTLGGSSVGGTLTLGTCQLLPPGTVKAWLGSCAPVDLRLRPRDKIRPEGFPEHDPLGFLEPLYDVYAGTEREKNREDGRCHPILARREGLPRNMLFVCAGVDILLHEQMSMVERLERERNEGDGQSVEVMVVEKGFHGFTELPSWIMEKERVEVFEKAIGFGRMVHRKHGFDFEDQKQRIR
ncbi:alpha/beta-hydrolase [Macroventuria anomochaeta]|uniref:Alpha/beta-hydrolase n=1 Tax=Macroventuria anomochaeta TaxID=301207 RepID=A0ACB6RW83_9PLEO|nr:alpha/beta-hydrolase [Macroventuria anomochaeta]KAF2625194.1 alpha/beta-hydrolase [Macroventuria anomochaeta]